MSLSHLIIILIIALLLFGPSRLEGIGSSLGKAIKGFKKGIEEGDGADSKDDNNSSKKDPSDPSNKT